MFLVIDIGATKTLIATFSKRGRCISRTKFLTNHSETAFLQNLHDSLLPFLSPKIDHVVLAVPGIVQKNYTYKFGNLPWSNNIPLMSLLKSLFSCKISILNDANLATLYETSFYSGKVIYLTFSTGIGGGIAKNGFLLPSSATFEPGHKLYQHHGNLVEWEDFASANAIKRIYYTQASELKNDPKINSDLISRLLPGLTDIIRRYNPDRIVIGGAIGDILPRFQHSLIKELRLSLPAHHKIPKISPAKRPYESVIYGEYLYAKKHKK